MFVEENFDNLTPRKKDMTAERIIVIIIIAKIDGLTFFIISKIEAAAPVRERPMLYMVTKDRAIIKVFKIPRRKRKPFRSCFMSSELITAAWPEPMPGRKEQSGAEKETAKIAEINCFFVRRISFKGIISCLGILVFCFIETNKEERPKRPESKGRSGSFIGRLN